MLTLPQQHVFIVSQANVYCVLFVCVFAEWVLVDAALHAYNFISVPLYDTLGPDAVEYICNHAELTAVACSAAVAPIMVAALNKCPTVKALVRPTCVCVCVCVCQ